MTSTDTPTTPDLRPRRPAASVATTGITFYGCAERDAAVFRAAALRTGVVPTLTPAPLCEETVGLASGDRCVSVDHTAPITRATVRALRRAGVEYLSTRSVGYDHIDVDDAQSVGLAVGNVAYSPDGVADYALMLLLMAVRHARSTLLRADDHDYSLSAVRGRELRDLTVGVVGTGRIGTAVVGRLRAFGCRVLGHDVRRDAVAGVPLDVLLRDSDVVTLHAPLTAATHHLLDRERLARMKPGAFVVNTGRGALVDTEALIAALDAGRLGGAALDVLEGEEGIFYGDRRGSPVESDALLRLQGMPNVVVSPHVAFHTDRALRDTVDGSIRNCLRATGAGHRA